MLGVGWTEMLVIGVVALIVIGPKELPALMQKIGKFAGTVRRMGQDFQREINKTSGLDEVKNLRTAITQPLKATTDAIRKEFNATTSTGAVQPSGALKPADPKAQSVVAEIQKAAGIATPAEPVKGAATAVTTTVPAEPVKAAAVTAAAAPTVAAATPVKAAQVTPVAPSKATPQNIAPDLSPPARPKRVAKAKAAPSSTVSSADLFPPDKPAPARRPRKPKAVESPAPVEAIAPDEAAPARPQRVRKPAAKKP
jgi:sec-independent protein translocase protein TatB